MSGVNSRQEKIVRFIAHIVMIVLAILALAPFLLLAAGSLTDNNTLTKSGYQFWPEKFSLEAYEYIIREWGQIGNSYLITIVVTLIGTVLSLLLISMAAYALAQTDIPGVKIALFLILLTMLFNGGVVSSYIMYTNIFNIKDTIAALIFPNLLMNGFNIILVRNYIRHNIPAELIEASDIDGAGQFKIYRRIVLPLSKPILAAVGLLSAVIYWNDWTNGLYYITNPKLYSIQLLLNQMNNNVQYLASHSELTGALQSLPSTSMRMAIAVVGILPIIILYPFFQKNFREGITMGAVKG